MVYVLTAKYFDNSGFKVLKAYQDKKTAERDKELIEEAGTDMVIEVHDTKWCGN